MPKIKLIDEENNREEKKEAQQTKAAEKEAKDSTADKFVEIDIELPPLPTSSSLATIGSVDSESPEQTITQEQREAFVKRWSCGLLGPENQRHPGYRLLNSLSTWNWQRNRVIAKVPFLLWSFFVSLKILGVGFKLLGGKSSAKMFDVVDGQLPGLFVGILATVLVQSSSTSTSMIIAALAADELSLGNAIPMIMGANIGTTVTNTGVAQKWLTDDKDKFVRAFAGATVHDLYNLIGVAVYLPIQAQTQFLASWTDWMTQDVVDSDKMAGKFTNPISWSVKMIAGLLAKIDKKLLSAIAAGKCGSSTAAIDKCGSNHNRTLNSTIAAKGINCDKQLLKGGWLHDLGLNDAWSGGICVSISMVGMMLCLGYIVKALQFLLQGPLLDRMKKSLEKSPYLNVLVGLGATLLVTSSTIVTTSLMPAVAAGFIPLRNMFELTVGANIGTTVTAIIAASSVTSNARVSWQGALVHLVFNILTMMLLFVIPVCRKVPIKGAEFLGELAGKHKLFPTCYCLGLFVAMPVAGLGLYGLLESNVSADVDVAKLCNQTANATNLTLAA